MISIYNLDEQIKDLEEEYEDKFQYLDRLFAIQNAVKDEIFMLERKHLIYFHKESHRENYINSNIYVRNYITVRTYCEKLFDKLVEAKTLRRMRDDSLAIINDMLE